MTSPSPLALPVVTIQPTFPAVIDEVRSGAVPTDTFWISCYKSAEPSIHSKVRVSLDEVNRNLIRLEPSGDVDVKENGQDNSYIVSSNKLGITETKILVPTYEYADPIQANPQHPHRITAFDVAPDGSQFATGFLDGSVHIYGTGKKTPPEETAFGKPHKSTTTSLRFFPSSRVLLSAGADFTLCILPADLEPASRSLTPARTLMGHRRAITSTAIVARGRNILSSSLDGTVRLWDVASGEKIHIMAASAGKYVPINSISLGERAAAEFPVNPSAPAPDPREVETDSKLLFCALQNGSFEAIDLGAKSSVHTSPTGTALSAITYSAEHNLLATGSAKGVVAIFDTRSLSAPVASFMRSEAGIADLVLAGDGQSLLISTDDGLPFVAHVGKEGPRVVAELVGTDCDPVRTVRVIQRDVWSAADDGVVRSYISAW